MADPIYGIHQSQPRDIYNFLKSNGKQLDLVGRFSYLPNLLQRSSRLIGMNDGIEMIITDEISFKDEPMMDGRVRRYAQIKVFMASFGTYGLVERTNVAEEVKILGYTEVEPIEVIEDALGFRSRLSFDIPSTYFNPVLFTGGSISYITAGVPRYIGDDESIVDAPKDGREYVRVDGEWVLSDHFVHSSIDGGEAII